MKAAQPRGLGALLHERSAAPLMVACHHKTGSCFLIKLVNQLGNRLVQHRHLRNVVVGDAINRKLPLSAVLKQHPGCDFYMNQWFEHEVDVLPDAVQLVHFVRHPVKWVRSAYLYHKKGAPSDLIRWLDWRVFKFAGEQLSYFELLNRVEPRVGLAIEGVRSYPEIVAAAKVARGARGLEIKLQFTLERVHEVFDEAVGELCAFLGFGGVERGKLVHELEHLDLSRASTVPENVTRNSSESADLERILAQDESFTRLFGPAAKEMGFELPPGRSAGEPLVPSAVVEKLIAGEKHVTTSWQTAQQTDWFMRDGEAEEWWGTYALQVPGCGHLMMQEFIQGILDAGHT